MKVSIIGAGFSGLSIAYLLQKKGYKVIIYEKKDRPGGLISTKVINDNIIETAANGFLPSSNIISLLKELDINIISANKKSKKRYIFYKNKLSRWPLSFWGSLKFLQGFLNIIFFKKTSTPISSETVEHWSYRLLGKEFTENILEPALSGIYAGDISKMSAKLVLAKLFDKKLTIKKSKKYRGMISTENGMGEIILKLSEKIVNNGGIIHYNSCIDIETQKNKEHPIIIATDLHSAKKLCQNFPQNLESLNICSVTLQYDSKSPVDGFGVLFPKNTNVEALGVLFNKNIFSNRCKTGHTETWILGGAKLPSISQLPKKKILDIIAKNRALVFSNHDKENVYHISNWSQALPHYTLELEYFLKTHAPSNHLYFTGNYMGQIGLSGILEHNINLANRLEGKYGK